MWGPRVISEGSKIFFFRSRYLCTVSSAKIKVSQPIRFREHTNYRASKKKPIVKDRPTWRPRKKSLTIFFSLKRHENGGACFLPCIPFENIGKLASRLDVISFFKERKCAAAPINQKKRASKIIYLFYIFYFFYLS